MEKLNSVKECLQDDDILSRYFHFCRTSANDNLTVMQYMCFDKLVFLCLKDKQEVAGQNLMFLLDYTYLSSADISTNNTTFTWAEKIVPIITST